MNILGITHPISWNNAACLLIDGELVSMVEEERLNRIKHSPRMPAKLAMEYCLNNSNLSLNDIDYIAIGFDKASNVAFKNLGVDNILSDLNQAANWLIEGKKYEKILPFENYPADRVFFINHHLAHAASSFFVSGFQEANIISLDGSGGSESGILATGKDSQIDILHRFPNKESWGLIYELITEKLGFRRHSGEGKVMGLAPYGKPDPNGLPFVKWDKPIPYIDSKLRKEYMDSLPTRLKNEPLLDFHKNLAATLQDTLERAAIRMAEYLYSVNASNNLCLAGGSALNCSMNGKLANLPFVKNIFIQPASHDSGTALGAALMVYAKKTNKNLNFVMKHAYWGPESNDDQIEVALEKYSAKLNYYKSQNITLDTAVELSNGKIIGWFQGRSEIGPRALGNRSILANPSIASMKDKVNNQVKHREPWRPFAPSILEEEKGRYFKEQKNSPFMILAFDTLPETRDEIIAAVHIDGTARPQTVNKLTNPIYWNLIREFQKISGIPAVLNTSFNVDSQPIVNTPEEAIETFLNCGIEVLSIGNFIAKKLDE
ncbi:MAG: hypothetical protein CVU39_04130 [Chloroflexi bacterium HGW-Chloroflexi-10]|nr:MAG: hypothetical protein CVU39_04130 [Chloroflexi bacterium HGW-Chloroflexi-10]